MHSLINTQPSLLLPLCEHQVDNEKQVIQQTAAAAGGGNQQSTGETTMNPLQSLLIYPLTKKTRMYVQYASTMNPLQSLLIYIP